jgi:peptidoglycan hydrolase-like protein with peptidoglycan-binding domain
MYMAALAAIMAMPSMDAMAAGKEHDQMGMGMEQSRTQSQTTMNKAEQLGASTIMEIQQALNEQGFDAGDVDGVWGNNTVAALRNFQQMKGLETTGQPNQDTLNELGVRTGQTMQDQEMQQQQNQSDMMQQDGMGTY